MLPAGSRLTHRDEFASTVRRGRRVGRPRLVVHLYVPSPELPAADVPAPVVTDPAPRAGFVVSRAVGGSVVRHRVTRRLRHLVAPRLAMLPPGSRLVVRALPPAADAPSSVLADDLDHGLRSALWRTNSGRTNSGRTGSGRTGVPVGGRS